MEIHTFYNTSLVNELRKFKLVPYTNKSFINWFVDFNTKNESWKNPEWCEMMEYYDYLYSAVIRKTAKNINH